MFGTLQETIKTNNIKLMNQMDDYSKVNENLKDLYTLCRGPQLFICGWWVGEVH